MLEQLQKQHFITFHTLDRGNVIRYKICDWARHNTVLEYNAPCQKDTGFFFLPVSVVTDLISTSRCSEMDIILDLWVSAVYNDNQVQGSDLGPVVYFRNGTGNPLVAYTELAVRWGGVPGDSRPRPQKAGRTGLYLPYVLPGPTRQRGLFEKLPVHHV